MNKLVQHAVVLALVVISTLTGVAHAQKSKIAMRIPVPEGIIDYKIADAVKGTDIVDLASIDDLKSEQWWPWNWGTTVYLTDSEMCVRGWDKKRHTEIFLFNLTFTLAARDGKMYKTRVDMSKQIAGYFEGVRLENAFCEIWPRQNSNDPDEVVIVIPL